MKTIKITPVIIDTREKFLYQNIKILENTIDILNNICDILVVNPTIFTYININHSQIKCKTINKIQHINDYNKFCLTRLNEYINADFCMILQNDGYIINPECWENNFLNFDYIGAPWPNKDFKNRVGNGGFSLRSKKFMQTCETLFKEYPNILMKYEHPDYLHEDFLACNIYYDEMINMGIKFADIETASKFSVEHIIPEVKQKTFGFHGNFIRR